MALNALPNELLLLVAKHLVSQKDLYALSMINSHFYTILETYLYKYNIRYLGSTVLLWASEYGREATLLRAIKEGANLATVDPKGRTPLSLAAENGHALVVKILWEKKAVNLNVTDRAGRTPLLCASGNGHESVVRLLLSMRGILPGTRDKHGRSPLWWAAGRGHEGVVRLLLEKEWVDINAADDLFGQTPLFQAVSKNRLDVVKLLLAQPTINLNVKDKRGETLLLLATQVGDPAIVEMLVEAIGARRDCSAKVPFRQRVRGVGKNVLSSEHHWSTNHGHGPGLPVLLHQN